ncbi:Hint domain-containing protein [uncultured Roseovarius sp.]|uniref:Hint domain-containing protein n=1 Tax=uncultured Roseovarius sp. TaxID=293344 RepID=UPI002613D3D7|nr:Hint domain-containing protein [uncultured Roseovarius sp.]
MFLSDEESAVVDYTNEALYLGAHTNFYSDNGVGLVGHTIGSAGTPAHQTNLAVVTHHDYGGDGTASYYDGDAMSYSVDEGSTTTSGFENVLIIQATITYTDGTSDYTGNFIVNQTADGSVFVVSWSDPANPSNVALETGRIETFTVNSVGFYDPNDGDSLPNAELTFVCFAQGTSVEVDLGRSKKVDELSVGDLVKTRDHGLQPIRWIGRRFLRPVDLMLSPKLLPVRFVPGSLGDGLPRKDLFVSPQHRMLVRSKIVRRMFDVDEVLCPATKLIALPGIEIAGETRSVTYFHLLFNQHEIIYAENAPTESMFTGPQALKMVGAESREEILAIFPEVAEVGYQPIPARFIPKGRDVAKLAERHAKNRKPLLSLGELAHQRAVLTH